ncbi:MAG: VOC family protein [bacterium]|nr:VOC family protein [bacterium]
MIGPLFEVILYVREMDAQLRFYRDTLGLSISWPDGLADYSAESWVALDAGGVTLALHSGGEKPAGIPPRFGFKVENIEASRVQLLDLGVSCSEVRSPAPGVQVVDCKDPEGNGFFIESTPY